MNKNATRSVYSFCFIAALGGLMFGMDQGTINGTLNFIVNDFKFSTAEGASYASIMMYGCVLGSLVCGWVANTLGRKKTLIIAAACFALFIITGATAQTVLILFTSRFLLGVTVGIASFAVPVYLSEIAPSKSRGGMVAFYQLMITIGILLIFITNAIFDHYNVSWRIMLGIIALPALAMLAFVFILPQSPRWLMLKGKDSQALDVLKKIRTEDEEITFEFEEIKTSLNIKKSTAMQLLTKGFFLKVLALGFVLQILNTLCGINPVMYYSTLIFSKAGIHDASAVTVVLGVVNMATTIIAVKYVDRIGKKPIIYFGLAGMAIMLIILSVNFYLLDHYALTAFMTFFLVGATILFVFSYAVSLGPTIWTICSEIFPLEGRDFGFAVTTATNWIFNAIAVNFSLIIMDQYGGCILFSGFSLVCILGLFFVGLFVPETKNISLEKIEINLKNGVRLRDIGKI